MTDAQKLANTIKRLYQKGRAAHIAFFRNGELVKLDNPSEIRFFDGIMRIFSDSTLDQIHMDWLVWHDDSHSMVKRDVVFFRDGHAILATDSNPILTY